MMLPSGHMSPCGRSVPSWSSRWAAWLVLPLAWACARATPSLATGDAGSAPSGSASVIGPGPSASGQSGPVRAPEPPVRALFHRVRELDCYEAILHVLGGRAFLSCHQQLLTIEGDEVLSDPAYQRGIEPEEPIFRWQITSLAGDWPNAAWLGRNRTTEFAAQGEIFRWTGRRWDKVADARRDEPLAGLLPWTERHVLALLQPADLFGARFLSLGEAGRAVPSFTPPRVPHERCRSRLRAEVQTAVAPGEVMVAGGQVCDVVGVRGRPEPVYSGVGVERFTAGDPRGQLLLIETPPEAPPDATWEVTALVAAGPKDVLLSARAVLGASRVVGLLARWDGERFRPQPAPFDGGIHRLWVESPAVLWATDRQGDLWRGRAGRWRRVAWRPPEPADSEITRVWVRSPNDVWLVTRRMADNKSVVYHGQVE